MNELRYIRILKIFISILLIVYISGISLPWIQIAFGYEPVATAQDTVRLSPTEYASATSLSVALYGAMFVVPLLITAVYTLRSLQIKLHKRRSQDSTGA